jgi:hypothetical protein
MHGGLLAIGKDDVGEKPLVTPDEARRDEGL